jgi:hypothetical protein
MVDLRPAATQVRSQSSHSRRSAACSPSAETGSITMSRQSPNRAAAPVMASMSALRLGSVSEPFASSVLRVVSSPENPRANPPWPVYKSETCRCAEARRPVGCPETRAQQSGMLLPVETHEARARSRVSDKLRRLQRQLAKDGVGEFSRPERLGRLYRRRRFFQVSPACAHMETMEFNTGSREFHGFHGFHADYGAGARSTVEAISSLGALRSCQSYYEPGPKPSLQMTAPIRERARRSVVHAKPPA